MKKIEASELKDLAGYERAREGIRASVIELKKNRRVSLGDNLTLLFENRETVLFQIQEMLRTERIVDEARVEDEVATYNGLIPDAGELSATLFIEIPDIARMSHAEQIEAVNRFQGLDREAVFLVVGERRIPARFEEGRTKEEKMSAVHFLRFAVPPMARAELGEAGRPVNLVVEHPRYRAEQALGEAVRAELLRDLAGC
jgi:hypothetical protein